MTPPVCPEHGSPLTVVEQGSWGGVAYQRWAGCPGNMTPAVTCDVHTDDPFATPRYCGCRASLRTVCLRQVRTETMPMDNLSLFQDEGSLT